MKPNIFVLLFMDKYRFYYLFVYVLLLFSCKEEKAIQLVKTWREKEIYFPENVIFTRYAKDTVKHLVWNDNYKILVYVDSIGCMSCKLQLFRWKDFASSLDSMTQRKVPILFFFQSHNTREIHYLLKRYEFDYPVCIDQEDRLNKLNKFPSSTFFRTFLLDEKNKVVLIGNPIHNTALKELYIKQILLHIALNKE